MSKKYCKNCKWSGGLFANHINYGDVKGWKWCEHPKEEQIKEQPGREFTGLKEGSRKIVMRKSELNETGECQYYKRKWWMFWIK